MIKTAISYFLIDWCIDILFDQIDKNISMPVGSLRHSISDIQIGDCITVSVADYFHDDVVCVTPVNATVIHIDSYVIIVSYATVVYDIDCGSEREAQRRYLEKDISGLSIADTIGDDIFNILAHDGTMMSIIAQHRLSVTDSFYINNILSIEKMTDDDIKG